MKTRTIFLIFIISFVLSSCATPLKQSQLERISTIGIDNQFNQKPRYMIIGSTVFTNKVSEIDSTEFYSHLSNTTKSHLESLGYNVSLVTNDTNIEYDLLLKLRPTSIYQAEFMQGYGVVEKFFLGESKGAGAYISMAIDPEIKGERKGFLAIYSEDGIVPTGVDHLADSWEGLSNDQQTKIKTSLRTAIEQTVSKVLTQIGL